IDRKFSWVEQWDATYRGNVKGVMSFGMNGVAIGPNSQKNIDALKKAEWLVDGDIYPEETSSFWESPGITDDEKKQIKTEVYRLPGAGFAEKDGTFVNSARSLKSPRRSTARHWLISTTTNRRLPIGKQASSYLALPGSKMTAPRHRAT